MGTAWPTWAICSTTEYSHFFFLIFSLDLSVSIHDHYPHPSSIHSNKASSSQKPPQEYWQIAVTCPWSHLFAGLGKSSSLGASAPGLNHLGGPLPNSCQFIYLSRAGNSKTRRYILDVVSQVCHRCKASTLTFVEFHEAPSSSLPMPTFPSYVSFAPSGWHHPPASKKVMNHSHNRIQSWALGNSWLMQKYCLQGILN